MSFEQTILLRLKRRFSKDEAVALLTQELSAAKFKIGELESEIAELTFEVTKPKEGKTAKQWKQDDFFKELKDQLNRTMIAKRDCKKEMEMWRNRYLSLVSRAIIECPGLVSKEQGPQAISTTEDNSNSNDG